MSSERRSSSIPSQSQSPTKVARRGSRSEPLEQQQMRGTSQPRPGSPSNDHETSTKPKRRRRAAGSQAKPAKDQLFYFVDSNSSSREKRAHVMRHHVQEKRQQRRASSTTSISDKHSIRDNRPHAPLGIAQEDRKHSPASSDGPLHGEAPGGGLVYQPGYIPLQPSGPPLMHMKRLSPTLSPETPRLGGPPQDAQTTLSREDLELADCWNKITYWSGQNKHLKDRIFQTATQHPLTFQAVVLAYCARWKAQLYNLPDSAEVQHHVGQAARGVEKALIGALPIQEDHLAMALVGMALQEERFGQKRLAGRYVDQAVQILRPRAGSSNAVEVFLHYVRYIMTPPAPILDLGPEEKQWLLTFLRGAEELMLSQNTPAYLSMVPQRRSAFQMDSPLFPLLSSGPRPSQVPLESRMYVVKGAPTQEISRTAALIYITATLWDFQDSPNKTNRFLEQLTSMTKTHGLDRSAACETLVWILLEEKWDADLRDAERGWSTGELLKMHKHLRPELQFQFSEILMSFLTMTPPIRGISFAWELEADA